MPVLHKSSGPKVKKPLHYSPPTAGSHSTKDRQYWAVSAVNPLLPGGNIIPPRGDIGFTMPSDLTNALVPLEQWGDQHPFWSTEAHNYPTGYVPFSHSYPHEEEGPCCPSSLTSHFLPNEKPKIENTVSTSSQTHSLSNGVEPLFTPKELPDFGWENLSGLASTGEAFQISRCQRTFFSPQGLRRSLLKLEMGLLEDLELLEAGLTIPQSPSLLHDSYNLPIETLELPIYRLLDHSSWLLEIIQSLCGTTVASPNRTSSPFPETQPRKFEDPVFTFQEAGENTDEGFATISPHDSGYGTTIASPDQTTTTPPGLKCDISLWLGVLEAHCTLVRIYRAVFTRLYQLFLIVPPTDAAMLLSLPSIRFGQFHLDGSLVTQVQLLVDWSSTTMADIDRALELCWNQEEGDSVHKKHWSTLIRDIVITQEQDPCDMPLMKLMECLRQLVKAPMDV
ncbi:hypothetical protein N7457_003772 [Penicillium paradoxum]|uniref:uncharacterized protein n=1 Tax=Penicillium paradoxum TaxID=176176 RepID=UPI002546F8C4|nr:uncharacterized protein N7457_003772 [Penicillium paradoxum]KAJ5788782.1 hypothetical protein N7457_003772 [Penicillium paradoxum]